nr:MAG TPA: hypothetical protein [Caudoviricetes sp.]
MDVCFPYLHLLWPSRGFMDNFFPCCRSFTSFYYINRRNVLYVNMMDKILMIIS